VPALIEIPERVIFGGRGLIRGELVYKLVDAGIITHCGTT
jgi:hypothetical protein